MNLPRRVSRYFLDNLNTLLVAMVLALAIWILAVLAADPNSEQSVIGGVPLTVSGMDEGLLLINELPDVIELDLQAPESIWDDMDSTRPFVASIDLAGLNPGEYALPVEVAVAANPVRIVDFSPRVITVILEALISKDEQIHIVVNGEPALGFIAEPLSINTRIVTISGPESLVNQVETVQVALDLSGARESFTVEGSLTLYDIDGQRINGLQISPQVVTIIQPVVQAGGYRDVAVKLVTTGQLANGYRVTNVSVSPLTITVFSADPQLVAEMPGFVSTLPLDLTDASDDIEMRLGLVLPEGVSLVGEEQSVQAQVAIAGIETSIAVNIPVEIIGLGPGLSAEFSPESLDLILTGPLPILDTLGEGDVRVFIDLTDLEVDTYLLEPQVEILPLGVIVESISPATIEVVISISSLTPMPTPSTTPTGEETPTPTATAP